MDAIGAIVSPILAPVTNAIENWLENLGISVPDFADISIDLLPFDEIQAILDAVIPDVPSFDG